MKPEGKTVGANACTLNLNGGTLQMNFINGSGGTVGIVNLNGSTIQAKGAAGDFLNSKTTYNVLAGGAKFDSAGYAISVQAPLLGTTGDGGLTKTGVGTLTLSGSNSYKGGTTVSAGTLLLGNANALGATTGNLAVNGGTLDLNGNSVTVGLLSGSTGAVINTSFNASVTLETNSVNSGAYGGAIQNGSGIVGLTKSGAGTLTLNGANTFTGDTVLNGGTLTTGIATALQNSTLNYNSQGGTLSFGTLTAATLGGLKGAQNLALLNTSGTGVNLSVGNNNASTTYTGLLTGTNSASKLTKMGTGALTLDPGAATSGTIANIQVITGTLALNSGMTTVSTASGAGNTNGFQVGGANAPTFVLNGGNLLTNNNPTIGSDTLGGKGTFTLTSGTWTNTANWIALMYGGTGTGSVLNVNGGLLTTPSVLVGQNAGTATVNLNGGTLQLDTFFNAGNSTSVLNFNGGTLRANSNQANFINFTGTGTPKANVLAGGAVVDTNNYAVTISIPLVSGTANDGGLTKIGAGTLTLSAANTYTGPTSVTAGKLVVGAALNGAANVTVGASAELQSNIAMSSTGTVAVKGKLTTAGLALQNGSTLSAEIRGTGAGQFGQVVNSGAITLDTAVNLALSTTYSPAYDASSGNFALSDKIVLVLGGYSSGSFANVGTVDTSYGTLQGFTDAQGHEWAVFYGQKSGSVTYNALNANDITLLAVPEPSTWAMLVGSFGMLAFGQRLRRRNN